MELCIYNTGIKKKNIFFFVFFSEDNFNICKYTDKIEIS
jgi:hypothetical protein